jgi:hypothetical protein
MNHETAGAHMMTGPHLEATVVVAVVAMEIAAEVEATWSLYDLERMAEEKTVGERMVGIETKIGVIPADQETTMHQGKEDMTTLAVGPNIRKIQGRSEGISCAWTQGGSFEYPSYSNRSQIG